MKKPARLTCLSLSEKGEARNIRSDQTRWDFFLTCVSLCRMYVCTRSMYLCGAKMMDMPIIYCAE